MIDRTVRRDALRRVSAGFLILTIPMAGFIFGSAAGEDPVGSGQIEPGTSLAAKIEKKALVHVVTPSGTKEIRHPLIVPEGLKSQIAGSTPIPWDEIQKIRYQGRATKTGLLVGAGTGAAIGAAACIGLAADDLEIYWWGYPLVIGGCALGGAAFGALIGAMFPKWTTLYDAAPGGSPPVARLSLGPVRRGGAMTLILAF